MTGSQLREFRKDTLQLTAGQLATLLGVTSNSVVRWEREEIRMPPFLELALKYLEGNNGKNWRRKKN